MRKTKKLIIGLTFVMLMAVLLCFGASAETEGYYTYAVNFGETKITHVDKNISGDIVIPSYLGGYPVTTIGESAFISCEKITSVKIPETVSVIEDSAFYRCTALESVQLPEGIEIIDTATFYDCYKLKNIILPKGLKSIGNVAFLRCYSLESIVIPEGVESIGDETFWWCEKLSNITLPDSLTSIGMDAFYATEYQWNDNNWENGVLYIGNHLILGNEDIENYVVKQGTKTIADGAFFFRKEDNEGDYYFPCKLTDITFPKSLVSVGGAAFYGCEKLTNVNFNEGLEKIDVQAFETCYGLTEITLPQSLRILEESAFEYCRNLSVINLGNNIETLGADVFDYTAYYEDKNNWENKVLYLHNLLLDSENDITSCNIKAGTKIIAPYAFDKRRNLVEVTFPDSLTIIGEDAFYYTPITKVELKNGLKTISGGAFSNCEKLTSVKLPNGLISIGAGAFYRCFSLSDINIPSSVKYIYVNAFNGVKMTSVNLNTEFIAGPCFENCSNLEVVSISSNIKEIHEYAFLKCSKLKTVYYHGSEEQWNKIRIHTTGNSDLLDANIIFVHTHEYSQTTINPTCTQDGLITFTCECGDSYTETVASKGHSYNDNGVCNNCNDYNKDFDNSRVDKCSCTCHKTGFISFIYKIIRFFWKLFKINPVCSCGASHY